MDSGTAAWQEVSARVLDSMRHNTARGIAEARIGGE